MIHASDCITRMGHVLCNCNLIRWCRVCRYMVSDYDWHYTHQHHQKGGGQCSAT
jgi:hypothetical protein